MASVYRDIEMEWQGEVYVVRPSMRLMQDIEQRFSISGVAHRLMNGDTPFSHVASIVGIMLRSAGCKVTDDEVFMELMRGDTQTVQDMAIALVNAAFPFQGDEGNDQAPAKKAAKKTTRKK